MTDRLEEIKARRAPLGKGLWEVTRREDEEFIDNAPADIDWLIKQAELARELGDLLPRKQLEVDRLRGLLARLERESLTCPVCAAVLHLGDQHGLDSDGQPCWLAKESGRLPAQLPRPER